MTDASPQPSAEQRAAFAPKPARAPERPTFEPVSDVALGRMMERARAQRSRHLGAAFLAVPLALLALLVLVLVLA